MSQCTSVFTWLLAPLSAPEAESLLRQAPFLSRALKLDLLSFIRLHLACQLLRYGSWHHAVVSLGSAPEAQPTVLPACSPPSSDQTQRETLRRQVASLKRWPTPLRWQQWLATRQNARQQPVGEEQAPLWTQPISVSQLSRANRHVPPSLWQDLIVAVLRHVAPAFRPAEMPDVGPVRAVDATLYSLPPSFHWAAGHETLRAAKIVVDYDIVTTLVQAPILTEGFIHEARTLRRVPKQPGTTYLLDRGFWSFRDFDEYCRQGIYFVTRAKDKTQVAPLRSLGPCSDPDILADEEVVIGRGPKRMEHSVRRITVRGEDGQPFHLITNRFDLPAPVISRLYRHRWQIELFFRWLKHYFPTRHFFGKSREAVYAQIAAAFLAHILLVYRYRQLGCPGSLLQFARCVSVQMFLPLPLAWGQRAA